MNNQLISDHLSNSNTFSHIKDFNFILDGKTHYEKNKEHNFYYCGSVSPLEGDVSKEVLTLTIKNWHEEIEFIRIPLFEMKEKNTKSFFKNTTEYHKNKALKEIDSKVLEAQKKAKTGLKDYIDSLKPSNDCDYLRQKKLSKLEGYEFLMDSSDKLIIPIYDKDLNLTSYQSITKNKKLFLKDSKVAGGFALVSKNNSNLKPESLVSKDSSNPILVAEGFATALSISHALDKEVYVAFSCSNLKNVCKILREKNKTLPIVIFSDNDTSSKTNAGLKGAIAASYASWACYLIPDFSKLDFSKRYEKNTDFNDLYRHLGPDAIKEQYKAFTPIKPSETLATEFSGFYEVLQESENGQPQKVRPYYKDLVKFFERKNAFVNLDGHKEYVEVFNGVYWESKNISTLNEFANTHFINPITGAEPCVRLRKNFKDELKETNAISVQEFTKNLKSFICLKNGVYDFENETLNPHSKNYPLRYLLDYDYDPDAKCPKFLEVLERVLPGKTHKSQQDLLLEFLGFSLSGDLYWTAGMLFLKGTGKNGKSTIFQLIRSMFDSKSKASFSLHDLAREDNRALLLDAKINVCEETPLNKFLSSDILKQITDHGVTNARHLYGQSFSFENRCKFIFSGNDFPIISDRSDGMYRRLKFIDFSQTIKQEDKEIDIVDQLKKERSGIFNLALSKYKKAKKRKSFSNTSEEVFKEFKEFNQSIVDVFFEEYDFVYKDPAKIDESELDLKPKFTGYAPFLKSPYVIINDLYEECMILGEKSGHRRVTKGNFKKMFETEIFRKFGVKIKAKLQRKRTTQFQRFYVYQGVGVLKYKEDDE